jgi:succinyl-CoA synthetase beta subunit
MKIHEYQGKEILRQFGVPVPRGIPAFTVQEAVEAAQKLGGPVWVVKAQIHAGGRGKGGGVKVAKSIDDVKARASDILGMQLVTHQTGPKARKSVASTSRTAPTSRTNCTCRWSPTAPRRRSP